MNSDRESLSGSNPHAAEGASRAVIVVVDDEPMVGEILAAVLDMEGYKARLFTDPAQALQYISSGAIRPNMIIADYAMAPMTGLELIERCRETMPELPAILCSGAFEDVLSQGRTRVDAYLSKPFLPRELIKTVARILQPEEAPKPEVAEGEAVLSN